MSVTSTRLLEEALALPEEERAALAEHILSSLDTHQNVDVEQINIQIAKARMEAYERGEIAALSEEETRAWLRQLGSRDT